MTTNAVEQPKVVSLEEWLAARKELLAKEKELTRPHDAISLERWNHRYSSLPYV